MGRTRQSRPPARRLGPSFAGLAARLPHEVSLDLNDLGLAADVDVLLLQDGHQTLGELLLLFPRLPDLADAKVPARSEADVRQQPLWRPMTGVLKLLANPVVLLRRHPARDEPDEDCHHTPPCRATARPYGS